MWDIALIVLSGGLSGGLLLSFRIQESRRRLREWEELVKSLGLQVVDTSAGLNPRLRARAGLMYVQIEIFGDKGRFNRIAVEAPARPDFRAVSLRAQTSFDTGRREVEIGDKAFDDAFFISGPPRLVLALLDEETRRLLLRLNRKCRPVIHSGELSAVVDRANIEEVLPLLLDVQKRFPTPGEVPRRLAESSNRDPEPGVRLQNLLILMHELSWNQLTDEALQKACSDPSPEIRLRAARQIGSKAQGVLLDLAEKLEDDEVSAKALAILDRELPFERVNAILGLAMRRRRLESARVCLESIGRRGAPSGVPLLAKILEREQGELARAAADALGAIGSQDAEPALIQALQREDAAIRVAAANALGRAGSAEAVLPLKEAAERSRLDLDLRRATRQAIAAIQSRVQGASPGQLSLTGAEEGRLSLPQTEAGQLSLAPDPGGQLSLGGGDPGT